MLNNFYYLKWKNTHTEFIPCSVEKQSQETYLHIYK